MAALNDRMQELVVVVQQVENAEQQVTAAIQQWRELRSQLDAKHAELTAQIEATRPAPAQ